MSKEKESTLLQLNVSTPSGSKKRYTRSKRSKKTTQAATPTKTKKVSAVAKPPEYEVEEAQNIVFRPNPGPQTEYLASGEREVLYGGAAGGGKSYATLADPLRNMNNSDFGRFVIEIKASLIAIDAIVFSAPDPIDSGLGLYLGCLI